MPAHARTQIRTAIATALTGLETTGANVYRNRVARLSLRQVPALVITIDSEKVDEIGLDPLQERKLQVVVDGYVAPDTGEVDDALDQIGLEVEVAMVAAGKLGGLIKAVPALSQTLIGIDETHEESLGRIRMVFTTQTFTAPADPGTVI